MLFEINILTIIVMAALGGICAYLANQNIAVFNDGLRPVYPQYLEGTMERKTLFDNSFALSVGLIFSFGIPISIAGKVILVNTIMLLCDSIGMFFPDNQKGKWLSTGVGALFGIALLYGMQIIMDIFAVLPIDFTGDLGLVGSLIIVSFSVFPAIAVAYQAGVVQGGIVLVLTMVVKQLMVLYGKFTLNSIDIVLDPNGMALLFGIVAMVLIAIKQNKKSDGNSASAFAIFSKNIERIKENLLILSISGGIVAIATTLFLIAEGPASLVLTAEGQYFEAAMVALIRTLGFIPLVMTTAIISGVYSPAGTKAVFIPAILLINMGIMGLAGSFVIGALIMIIEVLLLGSIAGAMDKFPGMKELGDNTRSVMSKVLDIALLVGGMLAANAIAPTIGYIWVIGLYFLNETSKKPLASMAIGPIGAITMGIIVNILHIIGLFPVG